MVEYADGSVLAQLGNPDMRTPIAHALAWPERHSSGVAALNLFDIARLDFEAPDTDRFPCLRLAFEAVNAGGIAPAVLNAANEVAVERFLAGEIRFTAIPRIIEQTLAEVVVGDEKTLGGLMLADEQARQVAEQQIAVRV
jgi:1-deoxy-D-xylulose-5-phosphate reductoisomerase